MIKTPPKTPKLNGVAERMNHTIKRKSDVCYKVLTSPILYGVKQ